MSQIERCRSAKSAGPHRPDLALAPASAGDIKFVNHYVSLDIRHANMQCKEGATDAKRSEKESTERAAAIDQIEMPLD